MCDVTFRIVLSLFGALSFTATIYHWWFVETSTDDVSDENKTQQQQQQPQKQQQQPQKQQQQKQKQQQQEHEMTECVKKEDAVVTNDDGQSTSTWVRN